MVVLVQEESLLACCVWTRSLRRLRRIRGGRASKPPTRSRRTLSSPAVDDPAFSLGYVAEFARALQAAEGKKARPTMSQLASGAAYRHVEHTPPAFKVGGFSFSVKAILSFAPARGAGASVQQCSLTGPR